MSRVPPITTGEQYTPPAAGSGLTALVRVSGFLGGLLWCADCATPPVRPGRTSLQSPLSLFLSLTHPSPCGVTATAPTPLFSFFIRSSPLLFNMRGQSGIKPWCPARGRKGGRQAGSKGQQRRKDILRAASDDTLRMIYW